MTLFVLTYLHITSVFLGIVPAQFKLIYLRLIFGHGGKKLSEPSPSLARRADL